MWLFMRVLEIVDDKRSDVPSGIYILVGTRNIYLSCSFLIYDPFLYL